MSLASRGSILIPTLRANARRSGPCHADSSRQSLASAEASRGGGFTLAHQRAFGAFTLPELRGRHAFTLIELLVVMGIIVLLSVLLVPAFTSLKGSGDITNAAYTITGVLEQARNDAMATNTYTWVGFYEESSSSIAATTATPPYPGKGRLVLAIVRSLDGTSIVADSDPSAVLPTIRIAQVGKLVKIEGVHVTDLGAPPSPTPNPTPLPNSLDGRPDLPYTYAAALNADHFNRISSDSNDKTKFWFVAQGYTFYKTVRFTPRGEANINSTYSLKVAAELGLVPTHGDAAPTAPPSGGRYSGNVVAIQFSGVSGNFKVYRQ